MYKKKKNSRLTTIPSTLWLYAVITVLLVLICLFVINQIRHGKDQSKQIEVLRITETEVKNIAVKINERIPNTNTIPESRCYKSAVNFGTGPIYCSNRIR